MIIIWKETVMKKQTRYGKNNIEGFMKENSCPDMREKIKEYISELKVEIDRCENMCITKNKNSSESITRMQTLIEIVNDLNGRLEERI